MKFTRYYRKGQVDHMTTKEVKLINDLIDDQLADHQAGTPGFDTTTMGVRCARHLGVNGHEPAHILSTSNFGWSQAAALYIAMQILYRQKEMLAHANQYGLMYEALSNQLQPERKEIIDALLAERLSSTPN